MMKIFFITCILATVSLVANCAHHGHNHAPIASPSPSPSLAPSNDCSSVIYNMANCISFLTVGSNDTKPGDDCCSGFESVLKFNPDCICEAIKSSVQLGVNLNITKAMALPSACGVYGPPISECDISLPPGTAPANPPETSPYPVPISKSPAMPPTSGENPTPVASPIARGGAGDITQVPTPSPSASKAHSMSTSFGFFIGMLVALFSYISMQDMIRI